MNMNNSNKMVAIHQPNFFPWLGYFDKINRADIFVFMDEVAYPKSGNSMGSWLNRVSILVQGKAVWIGCPVIREHGVQIIKDVIINSLNWREKLLKTILYNYSKAIYFDETITWLKPLIMNPEENLSDYNTSSILKICDLLGIKTRFIRQSELNTSCASTELLIEIVKKVDGHSYLCGGGASGYQEDEKFNKAGVGLLYQNFKQPSYHQMGKEFIAGLSCIDLFMNCGIEESARLVLNLSI